MDDLISRQAAIDMLKNRWKKTRNYEGIGDDIAEECELYLKQVPSAQPKKGHWVKDAEQKHVEILYHCSECGFHAWGIHEKTKFCGGCGAKMENPYEAFNL